MSVEVLNRESIYQGHAFNVRRDKLRFENQKTTQIELVEHPGAVTILPVNGEGQILFVRQYRHPTGKEMLELPAGTLRTGEPPLECAMREIREETGYAAGELTKVGEFFLAPGYSTEYMYVYVATDLRPDPLPGDEDEFITLEAVPIEQAYDMARTGAIDDGKSLAVLLLAQPIIRKLYI